MTLHYNSNNNESNNINDTKVLNNNLSSNHFTNSKLPLSQQTTSNAAVNLAAQYSNNTNLIEMIDNNNIVADETIVCDDEQQTNVVETNAVYISNKTINNGNIYKTLPTNANNNNNDDDYDDKFNDDTNSHQQQTSVTTRHSPQPPAMPSNCDLNNERRNNLSPATYITPPVHARNPSLKTINSIQHQNLKKNSDLTTVHVIVGNEACDLDSAVSCLLMFHILTKMSDGINGKDKVNTLYIPLLNTTRDLLESKSEVLWFLKKTLNIDKSFLTCKDDIDWKEIKKTGVEVLITLVDHNHSDEFDSIGKIVEIIDHHPIMNRDWLFANHSTLRLTLDPTVGSCTTLVAERLFNIYAEHHVADEILLLIYGTVLLDTICLSEKAKRFTRRDVYLLKKLDSLMGSKRPSRDELYKQLVEVKNTTKELNFEKLMKRDLKVFKDINGLRVGIASLFGMAAKEALGLAANINLDVFFQQHKYEAFIIMGLITDLDHIDSISRDLVVISANERLFQELTSIFEADTSKLDLEIVETNHNNLEDCSVRKDEQKSHICYKARIYLQKNVTSSRKVVAPLVLKVLHDGASRNIDSKSSNLPLVNESQSENILETVEKASTAIIKEE